MKFMKNNNISKTIAGVTLSLSILFSGSMFVASPEVHAASVSASSTASNIIATGNRFLGVPYQFGAKTGNTSSFDCSSFTQYVYQLNGVSIPRSSRQQSQAGTYVSREQLQPGDLVFFYSPIHHVAIYMGNGKLLHTFGKGGVTVTDLNSGWWSSHYATARRVIPGNGQAAAASSQQPQAQSAATPSQQQPQEQAVAAPAAQTDSQTASNTHSYHKPQKSSHKASHKQHNSSGNHQNEN
jgi:murein DD-endopeptidase / murein LD-carboxypeptidase